MITPSSQGHLSSRLGVAAVALCAVDPGDRALAILGRVFPLVLHLGQFAEGCVIEEWAVRTKKNR